MKKDKGSYMEIKDNNNYKQKMKKNEELQNEIHFAISRNPLLNIRKTGAYARIGKYMKIFSYLVLFAGIGIFFNSCMAGYETTQPSYMAYDRPQGYGGSQIWIEGNWNYNNQSHVYVQKQGYWVNPRPGHTYHEGYWQNNQHGKSWSKGHWQRDGQAHEDHNRN
jgi:hypothetical protein